MAVVADELAGNRLAEGWTRPRPPRPKPLPVPRPQWRTLLQLRRNALSTWGEPA
ncbi:MAG: hypothetical protein KatS3mg117_1266 [Geminicoccaceae bacterium]|nr:MAG: hypothetical protein KatS3mg117_1266 [Geminicoccaceae bacterium]